MADEDELLRITAIERLPPLKNNELPHTDEKNRRHPYEKPPNHREAKDFFHTIEKAAENTNAVLIKKQSRYRFRVYRDNNDVMIDLVIMDEKGSVITEIKKNITHEDFVKMIDDVVLGEGLFFDSMA